MSRDLIVYTAGVFDMFHHGHLNLIKMSKGLGDRLIVGVSTDEVVATYKSTKLVMSFEDRFNIVSAIRYVDVCVPQQTRDKLDAWRRFKFDVLTVGDDWLGKPDYVEYEAQLAEVGARVVYLPYTESVSSSRLRKVLNGLG